jgi:hypothetical protein
MTAADNGRHPDDGGSRRAPGRVDSSTRVNVALPFSQFKIQEPSAHLLALTALVEELAAMVAAAVPGPDAEALLHRAHELVSQVR